jgi:uncharacterized protein (TIGR02246 family)
MDETIARFAEAWNRHDVDALAAMWTDDGELNHPWGFHAVGRDAVRKLLAEEHAGTMRTSVLHIAGVTSRADARNVIAEIDGVLEQVQAPNGRSYELRHKLSVLFVPADEGWRIRTMTATSNPRS